MFDLSFAELALIIIVAVVFIGPKDLPVVLRALSKAMRSIRRFGQELKCEFDKLSEEAGVEDIRREVRMIRGDDGRLYESYDIPTDKRHDG